MPRILSEHIGEVLIALLLFFVLILFAKRLLWRVFGLQQAIDKEVSRRKSSEVRTGKIVEVVAPILNDFPVNIREDGSSTVFLGQPVDYVHFAADGSVTFIEVKSGASKLSPSQERIRAAVTSGRVSWEIFRLKG